MNPLAGWHDFFLLVGGASATLLGLVFVAASIAAAVPNEKLGSRTTRSLWIGPIIYAFVRVLMVAALAVVPGHTLLTFGGVTAALGLGDLGRMIWVIRGMIAHHRNVEALDAEDWRWYVVYPMAATVGVVAGGVGFALAWPAAMYVLAVSVATHLVVGIHNAWELADWLATLQ